MLRHIRKVILSCFWLVPVALLACFLLRVGCYKEVTSGNYAIKSGKVSSTITVNKGEISKILLKNGDSEESLELTGELLTLSVCQMNSFTKGHSVDELARYCKVISLDNCLLACIVKTEDGYRFDFCHGFYRLLISVYFSGDSKNGCFRRYFEVTSYNSVPLLLVEAEIGRWKCPGNISGGGLGLPIFVNDSWFISGAEPWIMAEDLGQVLSFSINPGTLLNYGETWKSDTVIIGGSQKGQVEKAFRKSVARQILPPYFASQYGTWCDFRNDDLNAKNIKTAVSNIREAFSKYGAKLDYCVIDDGWFMNDTIYKTSGERFPASFSEVSMFTQNHGIEMGVWLSLSGARSECRTLGTYGYETASSNCMCLAGKNYGEAMRSAIESLLKNDDVAFFRHDQNFFACKNLGHGHLDKEKYGTEANMRATAAVLDYERKVKPNVHQSLATGVSLSPWWLKYANTLRMDGQSIDYDFSTPCSGQFQAEMNSSDAKLYKLLTGEKACIPLYALTPNGIQYGSLERVSSEQDLDQWSDYVMNYFGRGTALRELNVNAKMLDENQIEVLTRGLNWAKSHEPAMLDTHMILGDPAMRQLYGFRGEDKEGHVYVSLRNASMKEQTVSLEEIGIASQYYRITYPYSLVTESLAYPVITIQPESVLIVESLPRLEELKCPAIINVKARCFNQTAKDVKFVLTDIDQAPDRILLYAPKKIMNVSGLHDIKKVNRNLWTSKRPVGQENPKVNIPNPPQIAFNAFDCTIAVPKGATAKLFWTVYDSAAKITIEGNLVNGIKKRVCTGTCLAKDGWRLCILELQHGVYNIHGVISDADAAMVASDLMMRAEYQADKYEVQMDYGLMRSLTLEDYSAPYLKDCDKSRETIVLFEGEKFNTGLHKIYSDITGASLSLEVFDVNGGDYANKILYLNSKIIGQLPINEHPISSWQKKTISIDKNVLKTIGNINTLSLLDTTGDCYKFRNVELTYSRQSKQKPITIKDRNTFCNSKTWSLTEGKVIPTDGTNAFLILSE